MGMSDWKEARGQTQSVLEGLHIPSGLVASSCLPPVGAGGCSYTEERSSFYRDQHVDARFRRNGWMDIWNIESRRQHGVYLSRSPLTPKHNGCGRYSSVTLTQFKTDSNRMKFSQCSQLSEAGGEIIFV